MKKNVFLFLLLAIVSIAFAEVQSDSLGAKFIKIAEGYKKNLKTDSAIIYFEKASDEYLSSKNAEGVVNSYTQIGVILTRQDKYENAMSWLNKALGAGTSLDSNNLFIATTYISMGVVYNAEENYTQSLMYHYKALNIRIQKLGEYDKDVATSYGNIGNVYLNSKNYDKSIEAHLKAMQIREKLFGANSSEVGQSYTGLGNAYREKNDYKNSLMYFEKLLKNKIEEKGPGHKDLIKIYKSISDVYFLMGNKEQGDLFKAKADDIK